MQEWFLWWHSRSRWLFSVACQSKKWINLLFIWGLITLRHKRAGSTCLRKCHQCGCVATAEYKLAMGLQKWSCQIQCTWTPEFRVFFSQTESHDSFCVKRGCRSVLCNWPGTGGECLHPKALKLKKSVRHSWPWRTAAPVMIRKLNGINKTSNTCHKQMLKAGFLGKCKAKSAYSILTEIKYLSWVLLS